MTSLLSVQQDPFGFGSEKVSLSCYWFVFRTLWCNNSTLILCQWVFSILWVLMISLRYKHYYIQHYNFLFYPQVLPSTSEKTPWLTPTNLQANCQTHSSQSQSSNKAPKLKNSRTSSKKEQMIFMAYYKELLITENDIPKM